MLENISLIASIISGITAVTTSFRALGKSRELTRRETKRRMASVCRTSVRSNGERHNGNRGLSVHMISTAAWFVLSVIFALPLIMKHRSGQEPAMMLFILPFFLLGAGIAIIWWKALHTRD